MTNKLLVIIQFDDLFALVELYGSFPMYSNTTGWENNKNNNLLTELWLVHRYEIHKTFADIDEWKAFCAENDLKPNNFLTPADASWYFLNGQSFYKDEIEHIMNKVTFNNSKAKQIWFYEYLYNDRLVASNDNVCFRCGCGYGSLYQNTERDEHWYCKECDEKYPFKCTKCSAVVEEIWHDGTCDNCYNLKTESEKNVWKSDDKNVWNSK